MVNKKFFRITIVTLALVLTLALIYEVAAVSSNDNVSGSVYRASKISLNSRSLNSASLGAYSDSACTVPTTSINWGSEPAGANVTTTVYIKNNGGTSFELSMATSNWNPTTANGPLTITWNQENTVLSPGQSTAANITLTVSSSVTGITNFNVKITISASAISKH